MTFDTFYPDEPFSQITTNQRQWYDPVLRDYYLRERVYHRFVTSNVQLSGEGAPMTTKITITNLMPPHANFDPIGVRQLWMPSSWVDSYAREIVTSRYGQKFALHEYDPLITYWQSNQYDGLRGIINAGLGNVMMEIMEALARNAMFKTGIDSGYSLYGSGGGEKFATVQTGDKANSAILNAIHLGMNERDVPYTTTTNSFTGGNIFCITSPGVIYDLLAEGEDKWGSNKWLNVMAYANPQAIVKNEYGTYMNVRFIKTPRAILYNCGTVIHQAAIKVAAPAGTGSPSSKVDGVFIVGQPGAVHYITVDDETGFSIGDIVTIHVDRTTAYGVTDGVDFNDGKLHNRRIVDIDAVNHRIVLAEPLMEDFTTDLGGTVFGYVTKGRNIHTMQFIGGSDGIVAGWTRAPRIKTPRPVDDYESMYRISFDMYSGYQGFNPKVIETVFVAGTNRYKGEAYVQ